MPNYPQLLTSPIWGGYSSSQSTTSSSRRTTMWHSLSPCSVDATICGRMTSSRNLKERRLLYWWETTADNHYYLCIVVKKVSLNYCKIMISPIDGIRLKLQKYRIPEPRGICTRWDYCRWETMVASWLLLMLYFWEEEAPLLHNWSFADITKPIETSKMQVPSFRD